MGELADTAMPLSEYLVSKGIDPAQAASLAAHGDSISRNRGMGVMAPEGGRPVELDQMAPPLAPQKTQPAQPTPAQLQESMRQHEEAQQAAHLDAHFAPPKSHLDYRFPASLEPQNEDAHAGDLELRQALHAEGLPRHVVESIASSLAEAGRMRGAETPEQAQSHQTSVGQTLERWYGKDTNANLALVVGIRDRLIGRGGATAKFVAAVAPHLDALSIDSLVQFARHRAARR
jgi:hypothetical protein